MDVQLFKLLSGRGSVRDIRTLLDNGARVDAVDHAGWTVLHWACRGGQGYELLTKILLSHGAPVNVVNHRGETPLHIASAHGCIKIGCMLLDHGARIDAKDQKGKTPLDIANPPTSVAVALVARKKEMDILLKENAQLIAVLGSKHRKKIEILVRHEREQLIEHVKREKKSIIATVQATGIESVRSTLEALQQRMNHMEQQLHQYQSHDHHHPGEDEPPMKRRRQESLEQGADAGGAKEAKDDDALRLRLQVTRCEKRLEEQHVEIAALREMVTMMSGNDLLKSKTGRVVSTSCNIGKSKVKMEEEAIGDNNDATDGGNTARAAENNDLYQERGEHGDHRDLLIATLEQKVEHLEAELEASQETAHCYKVERDEYKKKLEQLHQLTSG